MSQPVFAAEIGSDKTSIFKYEKGETVPKVTVLEKIVEKFNVNGDWLLAGRGRMFYREVDAFGVFCELATGLDRNRQLDMFYMLQNCEQSEMLYWLSQAIFDLRRAYDRSLKVRREAAKSRDDSFMPMQGVGNG
ncbi:MAG: helix-turn-helix domain-containing protein [bacterium]|nr:helix-turn-helix domain-containing protein [bacterium]